MMPDRADLTRTRDAGRIRWQPGEVTSPHLGRPVPVIAARDIPYIRNANRLQGRSRSPPLRPSTTPFPR
jgi:kynurenine formamidase